MDENIQKHYDSHQRFYEEWSGKSEGGYHFGFPKKPWDILSNSKMIRNLSNLVIQELDLRPGYSVLDAGCGMGHVALLVEKTYPNLGLNISGVTLSEKQTAAGKTLLAQNNSNVTLRNESFESTSFPDNSFDRIFFVDSLCHGEGESKERLLHEASRLLKSGGKIVVSDVFLKESPSMASRYFNVVNDYNKTTWAVDSWAVESKFLAAAKTFGIKKVREKNLTWKIPLSVMYIPFKSLPAAFIKSIRHPEYKTARRTLARLAVSSPLLGMHPNFRYKLMVLEKSS